MGFPRFRVVAVSATAAAAIGLAACGDDDGLTERTLRFADREGRQANSVDAPPRGDITPGDQIVQTRELLDGSRDRVGTVNEVCAVTAGGKDPTIACQGVVELRDGKLSFSVSYKLPEESRSAPVTGGTGAYEGATGAITASGRGNKVEIHLFVP
jgi:hypothetical protein